MELSPSEAVKHDIIMVRLAPSTSRNQEQRIGLSSQYETVALEHNTPRNQEQRIKAPRRWQLKRDSNTTAPTTATATGRAAGEEWVEKLSKGPIVAYRRKAASSAIF